MQRFSGLDFGTTNSALALADPGGDAVLARFACAAGETTAFRSVLFFDGERRDAGRPSAVAGPRALERYLDATGERRLLQSLKSFLASPLFRSTQIFGTVFTLEELIAIVLRQLRAEAEAQFGPLGRAIVLGRPVRFVNAEPGASDELPLSRLRAAAALAGFDEVVFELEPVAAAYFYEASLDHDELALIADFGGGTSDFSLVRVGPGVRRRGRSDADVLGNEGVGMAGDALDSQIVDHVLAPRLGMGSHYRSYFDGKLLPVPPWIYERLRRWHHLSLLKSRETMQFLHEVRTQAVEPDAIDALIHVVDDDLGYHLYRVVEQAKFALSSAPEAPMRFDDPPLSLDDTVTRERFEAWTAGEREAVTGCIDRLLARAGLTERDVDRVFMTGGTSFVPSVRALFRARFGEEKLSRGNELTSVASGLALRARDLR